MNRDIWLIGIGTGSPRHITREGQKALADAAVILVPRKGSDKEDLTDIRMQLISEAGASADIRTFDYPTRDPALPYQERVERWHDAIATRWSEALQTAPGGPVAMLVWGDPSLYDSTLRIAGRLVPVSHVHVVPGITALQALTAAHRIPLNTVNGEVVVTTGRRLRDHGWPQGAETVAVLLDGQCSFQTLDPDGLTIWWGGFLGMSEQILDQGTLAEAGPRIIARRAKARTDHGWIMDTYLIRRG